MQHTLFNEEPTMWQPLNAESDLKEFDLLKRISENQKKIADIEIEQPFTPETPNPSDFVENEKIPPMSSTDEGENLGQQGTISSMFTPESAINVFDVVMSRLATLGGRYAGYEIAVSDMKLNASEKATLKPHLFEVLKQLKLTNGNPFTVFAIVVCSIYGAKVLEAVEISKPKKESVSRGTSETVEKKKDGRGRPKKVV
jgi:hypothetical protein